MLNQRKQTKMLYEHPETVSTPKKHINDKVLSNQDLQNQIESLQKLLEVARFREKRLVSKLEHMGVQVSLDLEMQSSHDKTNLTISSFGEYDHCPLEPNINFMSSFIDRGSWLVGLLAVQSLSSFVLSSNESLLQHHPSIVYFLTMLVGAGGNAGNQAAVRVIRGIALGSIDDKNTKIFLYRELIMAICLSFTLGFIGLIRTILFSNSTYQEGFVISIILIMIVFLSIVFGSLLPLGMQLFKFDPAHASTTIQVIMDILGVVITCFTAHVLLDTPYGQFLIEFLFGSNNDYGNNNSGLNHHIQ